MAKISVTGASGFLGTKLKSLGIEQHSFDTSTIAIKI